MSKEKVFVNVISNVCIVFVLVSVLLFAFNSEVAQVFSTSKIKAVYRGNQSNANIALMINVYWGTEYLDDMLDTLQKNQVKVTFFVGGMWASENQEYLQKFVEQGHEIGNHGYLHKDHTKLSLQRNEEEIYLNHQLVKQICGVQMTLFAPPSGAYDDQTLEIANKLGYTTIMWSKDTIDWRDEDQDLVYKRATNSAQNGDLVLMHPTSHTAKALPYIIKDLKAKNFNLTTVSQTIK